MTAFRKVPVRGAEGILERARMIARSEGPSTLAVAVAQNSEVLESVHEAHQSGVARALLFGDRGKIEALCEEHGVDLTPHEIIHDPDPHSACRKAVAAAAEGRADVIMKGIVSTSTLMKNVLDRSFKLRLGRIMSHVAILDIPAYHKLLAVTDGGMVISSDVRQRVQILENAVVLMHALGVHRPRAALIAADDHVNLSMPVSCEAAIIAKMAERGQIKGALVDGPLPLDMAVHSQTRLEEEPDSPLGGDADILVVDNIESGNALIKSMGLFAGASFAGIVVGARVPLSLVSRSDTTFNKTLSIAVAAVYARHMKEHLSHD